LTVGFCKTGNFKGVLEGQLISDIDLYEYIQ